MPSVIGFEKTATLIAIKRENGFAIEKETLAKHGEEHTRPLTGDSQYKDVEKQD